MRFAIANALSQVNHLQVLTVWPRLPHHIAANANAGHALLRRVPIATRLGAHLGLRSPHNVFGNNLMSDSLRVITVAPTAIASALILVVVLRTVPMPRMPRCESNLFVPSWPGMMPSV